MTVNVVTRIEIERPLEKVAAYSADPENAPIWYVNIKAVEWKTPKPLQVGSQIAFIAHFLGKRLAYTYEIIEFVPQASLVMRTAEGPFPMETTYTWKAVSPNKTLMTLRNQGNPAGFSKFFAPFMALAMKRANRKDLQCLKDLLEKQGSASDPNTSHGPQ